MIFFASITAARGLEWEICFSFVPKARGCVTKMFWLQWPALGRGVCSIFLMCVTRGTSIEQEGSPLSPLLLVLTGAIFCLSLNAEGTVTWFLRRPQRNDRHMQAQ